MNHYLDTLTNDLKSITTKSLMSPENDHLWAVKWDDNEKACDWAFTGISYGDLDRLDWSPLTDAALGLLPKDNPFRIAVENVLKLRVELLIAYTDNTWELESVGLWVDTNFDNLEFDKLLAEANKALRIESRQDVALTALYNWQVFDL